MLITAIMPKCCFFVRFEVRKSHKVEARSLDIQARMYRWRAFLYMREIPRKTFLQEISKIRLFGAVTQEYGYFPPLQQFQLPL